MAPRKPALAAFAAALAAAANGHGGLIIPPCRNNRGNVNIFNFTARPGEKFMSGGGCAAAFYFYRLASRSSVDGALIFSHRTRTHCDTPPTPHTRHGSDTAHTHAHVPFLSGCALRPGHL